MKKNNLDFLQLDKVQERLKHLRKELLTLFHPFMFTETEDNIVNNHQQSLQDDYFTVVEMLNQMRKTAEWILSLYTEECSNSKDRDSLSREEPNS